MTASERTDISQLAMRAARMADSCDSLSQSAELIERAIKCAVKQELEGLKGRFERYRIAEPDTNTETGWTVCVEGMLDVLQERILAISSPLEGNGEPENALDKCGQEAITTSEISDAKTSAGGN